MNSCVLAPPSKTGDQVIEQALNAATTSRPSRARRARSERRLHPLTSDSADTCLAHPLGKPLTGRRPGHRVRTRQPARCRARSAMGCSASLPAVEQPLFETRVKALGAREISAGDRSGLVREEHATRLPWRPVHSRSSRAMARDRRNIADDRVRRDGAYRQRIADSGEQ